MRYVAYLALVACLLATPLKAQDNDHLEPMLQHVIDLPEMEQVFSEVGTTEKLYLVQTPVLLPGIGLTKFGQELEFTDEESAYYRSRTYVKFTDVSVPEPSRVIVSAFASGPKIRRPGEGVNVSLVLKEQAGGWTLENFRRAE